MGFLGVILIIVGVVLFFVQRNQLRRAFSIRSARSATVAELTQMSKAIAQEIGGGSWREHVKVVGTIECDRPLTSQLKQEPCVYYRMDVRREYEETVTVKDNEGNSRQETQRGSETLSSNQQSVPFVVKDQTGAITVDPDGADIETVKVLDEFRQEQALGGLLSFGGFSLALGEGMTQGKRRTLGYHYSESILPLHRRVLVLGTVSDHMGELTLQKPSQSDQRFIVSLKSDEELAKAADQGARMAFYGTIGCGIGGVLLILMDLIF